MGHRDVILISLPGDFDVDSDLGTSSTVVKSSWKDMYMVKLGLNTEGGEICKISVLKLFVFPTEVG